MQATRQTGKHLGEGPPEWREESTVVRVATTRLSARSRAANEVPATIPKLVPKRDTQYRGLDLGRAAAETLVGATWVVAWASVKSGVGSRLRATARFSQSLGLFETWSFLERRAPSINGRWLHPPSINHLNLSFQRWLRRGSNSQQPSES